MPEYLSPGVYIEEVDSGPAPIEGVSTSTTGAAGVTVKGPSTGKPVLVTSFSEFVRVFGGYVPTPSGGLFNQWTSDPVEGGRWWLFPLAVKGFFDNGGQRLYVKRVFASGALASKVGFGQGLASRIRHDLSSGGTLLALDHLIGIDNNSNVQIIRGDTGVAVGGLLPVDTYDPVARTIKIGGGGAPIDLIANRGDFLYVDAAFQNNATLNFTAAAVGAWGDDISVEVRPTVGGVFGLLNDPTLPDTVALGSTSAVTAFGVTTITITANPAFAGGAGRITINGDEYAISGSTATTITLPAGGGVRPPGGYPIGAVVRRLRRADPGGGTTINVWGAAQLYVGAIVELDNTTLKEQFTVQAIDGTRVTLAGGPIANVYWEGQKLRLIEAEVRVEYDGGPGATTSEVFSNLRLVNDGSLSYLPTMINTRSALVRVSLGASFSATNIFDFPAPATTLEAPLTGGDDTLTSLTVDDFAGVDGGSGKRTGVLAFEDIDEISICAVPGMWSSTVRSTLIQHCETLKDRFAIIDPEDGLSIEGIRAAREPLDTKYAAIYYPWLRVRDPSIRQEVAVPPSGHMAGIYARVDVERGVHKSPANEVIRGITRIDQDVTKREQDLLNPVGINVLRFFPERGNRVWGARTLSSDGQWRYICVRRLFIFLEESIDEGTQWVVFEPNDEPLWARIRASVGNFLTTVWRSGALQGTTPGEAFFVKVDRTTMTQDDIDNGRLIILVGVAPVKPAEFVIFRISQKTLDNQSA
jgi:hypothetical protein